MSAMVTCLSLWAAANRATCSPFMTLPSSFISSLMTPTGGSPLSLQRSTAAVAGDQREHVAGPRKIVGPDVWIGQRAAAGGAFVGRNTGAAIRLIVNRHREGGGMARFIVRHHRIEPQPPRVFGGDRR